MRTCELRNPGRADRLSRPRFEARRYSTATAGSQVKSGRDEVIAANLDVEAGQLLKTIVALGMLSCAAQVVAAARSARHAPIHMLLCVSTFEFGGDADSKLCGD
jgi:hypothetical protein